MIYKIDLSDLTNELFARGRISDIYSINFINDNYITLSVAKNKIEERTSRTGLSFPDVNEYYSYHSIQIINLKEKKMVKVLELDSLNKYIFVKNLFHPKYEHCLLTQDACGEILI